MRRKTTHQGMASRCDPTQPARVMSVIFLRSRVLSESEKFLKRAFELWDLLMAPTATNRATMRTGMQAQIGKTQHAMLAAASSPCPSSI